MKKILLILFAALIGFPAIAATGDVTNILDQSFKGTTLVSSSEYTWGSEIQGMITGDGLYMTNTNNKGNNYENREFMSFANSLGSSTNDVIISYNLYNAKGFGQAPAYYSINYFDGNHTFLFGIKESIGNWKYPVSIITANEDGTTTESTLPVEHMEQGKVKKVELKVKFTGNKAIISIDEGEYTAYAHEEGILDIKLSVSGSGDQSRGMNIQNIEIKTEEVEAAKFADYTLKYVCDGLPIDGKDDVTKSGEVGSAVSVTDAEMAPIWNADKTKKYIYVSNDASGKTVAEDGTTIVTLTYREAATWNYTVNAYGSDGKLLGEIKKGSGFEKDDVTYHYPEFYLQGSTLYSKAKNGGDPYWGATGKLDAEETEFKVTYNGSPISNVVFYKEAEEMEGFTSRDTNNAPIRCSNGLGGTVDGDVLLTTLPSGKYQISGQVWGTLGLTAGVKIKATEDGAEDTNLWELASTGSLASKTTEEELSLYKETKLYVYTTGGNDRHMLDLIYITGTNIAAADYTIKFVDEEDNEIKDAVTGRGFVGDQIKVPEEYQANFENDGTTYIYDCIDPETPIIAAECLTVVTVKYHKQKDTTYTVKFVDQDGNQIKDPETRTGDIGSKVSILETDKDNIEYEGATYVYDSDNTDEVTLISGGTSVITIKYIKLVSYTIKFVDESGTEIKNPLATNGPIGSEIDLSKYMNGISVDGKVYFYVSASYEPEGNTVAEGKTVTITFVSSSKLPYERTESTWSEADLNDWKLSIQESGTTGTQSIEQEKGLQISVNNAGATSSKVIDVTENSILTLKATLHGGAATGRAGSYDLIKLGDVEIRMYGQDKKASVAIGETETELRGYARDADYDVIITIDQAYRKATVTVSGGASGEVTGRVSRNAVDNIVFGHYKAGKENYAQSPYLKSINVSEELQDVTTADYTINYICDEEIIKSEEGTTDVDNEVTAVSTLTVNGQKYYVLDDATTTLKVTADGANVLNVNVRKASVYNYTVKNNVNDTPIATGKCTEGESVTVPYSKYILADDGIVYTKGANGSDPWYGSSITPDSDNYVATLEYTKHAENGIYFVEGENIEGMTEVTGSNANIRCSNQKGGYAVNAVEVQTLQPGTYSVKLGVWGNEGNTFIVKAGEESVLSAETKGYWYEAESEEFTLKTITTLTFEGATSSRPLDYILITGTKGIPATGVTINDEKGETLKNLELVMGDTQQLSATVIPEYTTENTVTWSSDNKAVATVDETGLVTAVGVGKATITATAGEASAECAVKCNPLAGDADLNGKVETNDAVLIINHILERTIEHKGWTDKDWAEFFPVGADANKNGEITISDAAKTVDIVLTTPISTSTQSRIRSAYDDSSDALVIGRMRSSNGKSSVAVALDNSMEYVALQADIFVPEGVNFEVKPGSRIADSHIFRYHRFDDNHIRLAIYSLENETFADNNEALFEIVADSDLSDAADITLVNVIASDSNAKAYSIGSKPDGTTGVAIFGFDDDAPVKVYDLNGRCISDKVEGLEKGIYIVRQGNNAKKVQVK